MLIAKDRCVDGHDGFKCRENCLRDGQCPDAGEDDPEESQVDHGRHEFELVSCPDSEFHLPIVAHSRYDFLMKNLIIALLFSLVTSVHAASDPKIIAVATDSGGYPAKALCFFSNNYMVPHPEGLLVLYTCLGGPDFSSEIWLVNDAPKSIGTSTMGNLFSEPFVRGNDIYYFEYNEFRTLALWKYSDGVLTSEKLPAELAGCHVHDFALLGDTFYFRYTNHDDGTYGEGTYTNEFKVLPNRGPTFFWKASFNGEVMIQKTKLANGEAIELRTKANPEPVVILRDSKADITSPFLVLRNQFAINGTKWATVATTKKGLTLIRGEGNSYTTEDLSSTFKDIQYWPPALAKSGEIIFRATDMNKTFALWGFNNGVARVIVGSEQEITEGTETVVTSSRALLYNPPVIDAKGNLYIGVGLKSQGANADFGQGILSLRP